MRCLKDFVSPFQGCNAPSSQSGLYLSDLPGIEFANIDEIANKDEVTWQGVWNDLQNTAVDTFREDIINEFGKRYQLKQITQTVDLGKNIDDTFLTPPIVNTDNGILLETLMQFGQCVGSNLMGIYVQEVKFYWQGVNPNPSFTLTFKDADLLNVEYTVMVSNAVAGWNSVWINKDFTARRLYVLASGNFDNYVKLDISQFNLDNFGNITWGWNNDYNYLYANWGGCGIQSRLNGVTYNSNTNVFNIGLNTFGLSIIFSTKCSWDNVVCLNKSHFASAWQHCLAIELLNYRINTSRVNRWVTTDKKQAIELQKLLSIKYRGGMMENGVEYPGKLQSVSKSLVFNDRDGCLRMDDYLMFRESRL